MDGWMDIFSQSLRTVFPTGLRDVSLLGTANEVRDWKGEEGRGAVSGWLWS